MKAISLLLIYFLQGLLFFNDFVEVVIIKVLSLFSMVDLNRVLERQSFIEDDSAWQLMQILREEKNSACQKKSLINHVLEEREHAEMLRKEKTSKQINRFSMSTDNQTRVTSYQSRYFVKIGERMALQKYRLLLKFKIFDHNTAFQKIIEDEETHEKHIAEEKNRSEILKALWSYFKIVFMNRFSGLMGAVVSILMVPFYYFLFFPISFITKIMKGEVR